MFFSALPARGSDKSSSGDGGNGGVLMVIVLDAFEPLQINNAEHCQRQADRKEQQTHIEPPPGRREYQSTPHYIKNLKAIKRISRFPNSITF